MCVLSLLNPVLVVLVVLLVPVLVAWYRYHKSRARMVRLISRIPGPPSLPIIGNTFEISVGHDGTFLVSPPSVSVVQLFVCYNTNFFRTNKNSGTLMRWRGSKIPRKFSTKKK